MLFVVNAEDGLLQGFDYSVQLRSGKSYYVLDTDDLVVEKVPYNILVDNSCLLENVVSDESGLLVLYSVCFDEWITRTHSNSLSCLNGKITYDKWGRLEIGEYDTRLHILWTDNMCTIAMNDKWLCQYQLLRGGLCNWGIGYVYKCSEYLLVQLVCSIGSRYTLTSIALDFKGRVIDIFPDKDYLVDINVKSRDTLFSSKYDILCQRGRF